MVNNMILWSCISANFEGFKLAERSASTSIAYAPRSSTAARRTGRWKTQIDRFPMPWAEKDMRIVLSEADHLRLSVPLCGVVTEVVKSVKIERGWPTPVQRET
jgi:3-hydroxyisobutyrate dehydrogenase-like beta-hydroxyacid dehydrogenase